MTEQNTQSPPTPPSDKKPKIDKATLYAESSEFYKAAIQFITRYNADFRSKIYALPEVIALLMAGYVHEEDQDSLIEVFYGQIKEAMPEARKQIAESERLLEKMRKMSARANVEAPPSKN